MRRSDELAIGATVPACGRNVCHFFPLFDGAELEERKNAYFESLGRAGDPDEIGPLAVYLASPASSYVTGASFVIDGGYTLW